MEATQNYITTRLILKDEIGRLIMGIRPLTSKQRAGELDFFGGKVDEGEAPDSAAIREIFEETGVSYNKADILPLHQQTDQDGNKRFDRKYFLGLVSVSANQINMLPEHLGVMYITPETALDLLTFEPHRQAILHIPLQR